MQMFRSMLTEYSELNLGTNHYKEREAERGPKMFWIFVKYSLTYYVYKDLGDGSENWH